jgi:hypothetical protein
MPIKIQLRQPQDGTTPPPLQRYTWPLPEVHITDETVDAVAYKWEDLEVLNEDRSRPAPVQFIWDPVGDSDTRYELSVSRSPDLADAIVIDNLTECQEDVYHLYLDTQYFWRIRALDNAAAESAIHSFTTSAQTPRWIHVEGATNVRDLGGWPLADGNGMVRQGLIYRGSELNIRLPVGDDSLAYMENKLGIRTDLDFRGSSETASPALDEANVDWVNIPIAPYDSIAEESMAEPYRAIFEVLATPDRYPIYLHCVGGADRAGTVALLINGLLGVSTADLITDYELTSLAIWGERSGNAIDFINLLRALGDFGSLQGDDAREAVSAYLSHIGVSEMEMEMIRRIMIEPLEEERSTSAG